MNTRSPENPRAADRRSLLAVGALALVTPPFIAPSWVAHAFGMQDPMAQRTPAPPVASTRLAAAIERARTAGKPLMVILVPAGPARELRGKLWGDVFGFATDDELADFVLCEWTCIDVAELTGRFPKLAVGGNHVAALIETDGTQAGPALVAFDFVDIAIKPLGGYPVDELRARATRLATLLRAKILPNAEAITRRATQCQTTTHDEIPEIPKAVANGERPRLRAYDAWAAVLRQITHGDEARAALTPLLAQACASRLWESDLDGARWQREHIDPCPPCGMGRVGMSSRAFLEFYTAPKSK